MHYICGNLMWIICSTILKIGLKLSSFFPIIFHFYSVFFTFFNIFMNVHAENEVGNNGYQFVPRVMSFLQKFFSVSMGFCVPYYVLSICIGGIFDQTSWRTEVRRRKT